MRDYYRRVLLDRWDDLLDVSPDAQRLYHYAMTGPTSTAYGLSLVHLGRVRRDLSLTAVSVQAAIVELVQAEIVKASEVSVRLVVVVDEALATANAPRDANNHIAAVKRTDHIPACTARDAWIGCLRFGVVQLPESTGSRGSSPSLALPKPSPSKNKNKKEKENFVSSSTKTRPKTRVSDLELLSVRSWSDLVAEPHSLPVPPTTPKGFVKNRSLRAKLQAFIRREPTRDLADYFARVETMITGFHRGENDRGWVANLDWAIRPKTDAAVASTEGSTGPSSAELEAEIAAIAAAHNKGGE
tara:strand:- start:1905 stop:2804 length:900 start_codon:yes stop_codon:yes gene_type:complete